MTRLEQLHQFLQEAPEDPFNLYALALEYQKVDRMKAKELFDQLMAHHETYLPTYYHAGNLYRELDLNGHAKSVIEKGMEQARKQNERKALRELQTVYDELNSDE